MVGISGSCIAGKNLDLIACTSASYLRFARKWSWEASKEARARGLVGSTSLPRALSLVHFAQNEATSSGTFMHDARVI